MTYRQIFKNRVSGHISEMGGNSPVFNSSGFPVHSDPSREIAAWFRPLCDTQRVDPDPRRCWRAGPGTLRLPPMPRLKSPPLTRAIIRLVGAGVRLGVPWTACVRGTGQSPAQLRRWVEQGRALQAIVATAGCFPEGSTPMDWRLVDLAEEIDAAHADAILTYAKTVGKAAKKSWQAAAWWLDRRAPEDFGRKPPPKPGDTADPMAPAAGAVLFQLPANARGPALPEAPGSPVAVDPGPDHPQAAP